MYILRKQEFAFQSGRALGRKQASHEVQPKTASSWKRMSRFICKESAKTNKLERMEFLYDCTEHRSRRYRSLLSQVLYAHDVNVRNSLSVQAPSATFIQNRISLPSYETFRQPQCPAPSGKELWRDNELTKSRTVKKKKDPSISTRPSSIISSCPQSGIAYHCHRNSNVDVFQKRVCICNSIKDTHFLPLAVK